MNIQIKFKNLSAAWVLACFVCCRSYSPSLSEKVTSTSVERLKAYVIQEYPHPSLFTEGFFLHEGLIYESAGPMGQGGIFTYSIGSREPLLFAENRGKKIFPEGIASDGKRIVHITETGKRAKFFDLYTNRLLEEIPFDGVGWGLCYDGEHFIRSDGTSRLFFHDVTTFKVGRVIDVTLENEPVTNLNELECVNGKIYANIWFSKEIIRIDAATGKVDALIDVSPVVDQEIRIRPHSILNGIAYDPKTEHFLITGKRWGKIYEVKFE